MGETVLENETRLRASGDASFGKFPRSCVDGGGGVLMQRLGVENGGYGRRA